MEETIKTGSIAYEPRPPSPWLSATELPRTLMEAACLLNHWPVLRRLPAGDGHPVLVMPGFAADDDSTWLLRRFLTQQRYRALPWRQGTNTGAPDLQERMVLRMYRLIRMYRQPISLIGQSLGGVFARELARRFPDDVRQVITLGSPFGATEAASTNPMVLRLFEQMSGLTIDEMQDQMPGGAEPTEPVGVPSTAIYSRSDGVVQWETCVEHESPDTENIEVVSSHTGMAMNAIIYYIISDRLSQKHDDWQKFDKASVPSWLVPDVETF